VVVGGSEEMRDARRRMYVGVVIAKRRRDCAREMKVTLKMKKSGGEMFLRRISQR
jgi:hypothetical protein